MFENGRERILCPSVEPLTCVYTASCWYLTLLTLDCVAFHILCLDFFYWMNLKLCTFCFLSLLEGCCKGKTAEFEIIFFPCCVATRSIFVISSHRNHLQCLVTARCTAQRCFTNTNNASGLLVLSIKFKNNFLSFFSFSFLQIVLNSEMHLKKINYFILHGEIKLSLAARQTSLAARQIVVLFSGTQTVLRLCYK